MSFKPGISVIICCYNSSERILETLKYLMSQDANGISYEILIIDNASTDNLQKTIENFYNETYFVPLSYLYEPIPGKTNALLKGILNAQYNTILICDDDNWLEKNYLEIGYKKLWSDSNIGIVGGWGMAVAKVNIPDWFYKVQNDYACGQLYETSTNTTGKNFLWGAGMFIKRELALKIFDLHNPLLLTCRKGEQLISGGDDEICIRAWLLGYQSIFEVNLTFQHFMPENRLNLEYYEKLKMGFQFQSEIINSYRRAYEIKNVSITTKFKKITINLLRYAKCFLNSSSIREKDAKDYLYYLIGITKFENNNNKKIKQFIACN